MPLRRAAPAFLFAAFLPSLARAQSAAEKPTADKTAKPVPPPSGPITRHSGTFGGQRVADTAIFATCCPKETAPP